MTISPPTENFEGEKRGGSPWLIVGGVVAVLVLLALLWGVLGGGRAQPTPEPTAAATEVAESSDAVCERVDSTGALVVGTAGDYPPFEYYNDQFQLDGFDVALMESIGQNLGVTVDFKDYAFDGLEGALRLGEIDAAIAAITITNEREAVIDFSDGYYYGRGAAVARAGSEPSSISTPADFAGWRVGVERGTVYQSWAEANLVAPGIVPEQQLFVYERAEDALGDLTLDRLDVVLLDDAAAESEVSAGGLAIVGEGAVAQIYAVAIPQGAACIQARINGALADLAAAGVIDEIAREFIGVITVPLPTPTPAPATPAPTATAAPPPVCIDSSEFVMDLTYDDQDGNDPPEVQPGEDFTKGWRIRNSGSCRWGPDYRLNYVGGNNSAARMDGEATYITAPVEAGQTYDFYVDLTAPEGVYGVLQGRWQMQAPGGDFFGQTVWVMVDVVAPTPGPTAVPPTVQPTAQPTVAPTTQPTAGATATVPPQPTEVPSPTPVPDPLFGQTFGFYAIRDQATIPDVPLTVTFGNLGGTGGLSGFDGCNTFGGTYTVTPSSASQGGLTISLGAGSTAACAPEIMDQAQAFRQALAQTSAYVYPPRGLLLELLDASGTETLSGELQ